MTTLALLGAGYVIVLAFTLTILMAAKLGDENMARQEGAAGGSVGSLAAMPSPAAWPPLGRLATTLHDVLDVERVTVVVSDAAEPGTGVVAACFGAPGLLGSRVRMITEPATGLLSAGEASALGLAGEDQDEEPWAFAQLPITGTDELLGAVTVASRRQDVFSGHDLRVLERLARHGAPQFDRRAAL